MLAKLKLLNNKYLTNEEIDSFFWNLRSYAA